MELRIASFRLPSDWISYDDDKVERKCAACDHPVRTICKFRPKNIVQTAILIIHKSPCQTHPLRLPLVNFISTHRRTIMVINYRTEHKTPIICSNAHGDSGGGSGIARSDTPHTPHTVLFHFHFHTQTHAYSHTLRCK